jgi:hypothetical protein
VKIALSFTALALSLATAGLARAQPPGETSPYLPPAETPPGRGIPAPSDALELLVGGGYAQGFGNVKSGLGLPEVATPGAAFNLGIGYRIDPRWAVLWQGGYAELTAERASAARSFTTGLALQYHVNPMHRVDPWLSVGVGYRFFVEQPAVGPNLLTHGFQLGRLEAGIDFRTGDNIAFGPMIGADATVFLFQDIPNAQTNIPDPRLSTFVFAGLQGRFDVGGSTKKPSGYQSASASASR